MEQAVRLRFSAIRFRVAECGRLASIARCASQLSILQTRGFIANGQVVPREVFDFPAITRTEQHKAQRRRSACALGTRPEQRFVFEFTGEMEL